MDLYEVSLSMSLLGLGWGLCWPTSIYVVLRAVFLMLVRNASPEGLCVLGA